MRCIYMDRLDDGQISVRVHAGISKPKTRLFADRDEAMKFAETRMGRKGMVLDTTMMSPEQLAAHRAREARSEAILKEAIKAAEPKGE